MRILIVALDLYLPVLAGFTILYRFYNSVLHMCSTCNHDLNVFVAMYSKP